MRLLFKCRNARFGNFDVLSHRAARNTDCADNSCSGLQRNAAAENNRLAVIADVNSETHFARLRNFAESFARHIEVARRNRFALRDVNAAAPRGVQTSQSQFPNLRP